jgi:predicted PurR-regulated permease PerM
MSQHNPDILPGSEDEALITAVGSAQRQWRNLGLRLRSITPRRLAQIVIAIGVVVTIIWFINSAGSSLVTFLIGAVLAYVLLPLVKLFERVMPRVAAVILVLVIGLALIIGVLALIIPAVIGQLAQAVQALTDTDWVAQQVERVEGFYSSLDSELQVFISDTLREATETIRENIGSLGQRAVEFVGVTITTITGTIGFVFGLAILPIWLFFVLTDRVQATRWLDAVLPPRIRDDVWAVWHIFDRAFYSYLRSQLFLGVIVGTAIFFGLSLLNIVGFDIRYVLLLAVFAGIMELLPYIGPFIGMIPAVIVALLAPENPAQGAVAVVVLYAIVQNVESNILVPKIMGDTLNIHPAILAPIMIGMSAFGFIWVILAPPLTAVLRDLVYYFYGRFNDPPRPPGLLPAPEEMTGEVIDEGRA